jgi:hypothetical protein
MMSREIAAPAIARERAIGDGGDAWYEHAWKYPVAVAADLGQNVVNTGIHLYNFLAPESIEAKDISRYAFMTNDLAAYTKQHTDAVNLGSFMAGAIIPGFGISKAMSLARTGAGAWGPTFRGVGLHTFNARIEAASAIAEKAAKAGASATADFQAARRTAKAWTMGEAVAENVLFEASVVGLMSQHPYFEEGWNPTLGLGGIALGAGVGGWLKWAKVSGKLNSTVQAAQEGQIGVVKSVLAQDELMTIAVPYLQKSYGWGTVVEAEKATRADYMQGIDQLTQAGGGAPVATTQGVRVSEFLRHATQQTEKRILTALHSMSDKSLRATEDMHEGNLHWDLVPDTANPGAYLQPGKQRMAYNYMMGQVRQGLGVQELNGSLHSSPVENMRAPWKTLSESSVSAPITPQFWDIMREGTDGLLTRTLDPVTNTHTLPPLPFISKLDKLAKVWSDPVTNTWHFDLSAIKGDATAMHYLALKIQEKGAANIVVEFGARGGNRFDRIYQRAGERANETLSKDLAKTYSTVEDARQALPSYMDEYQAISWWNGETVAQSSIAAHMTKRAGHAMQGYVHTPTLIALAAQINKGPMRSASGQFRPYEPVHAYFNRTALTPTAQADSGLVHTMLAMERLAPPGTLPVFKAAPSDLWTHQAAYTLGASIDGLSSTPALLSKVQQLKVDSIRDIITTPGLHAADPMQLSIHTNTPVATVNLIRQALDADPALAATDVISRYVRDTSPEAWLVYRSVDDARAAIHEPSVSIRGQSKNALNPTEIAAKLDAEGIEQMAAQIVDDVSFTAGQSNEFVRTLYEGHVRNEDMAVVRKHLDDLASDTAAGSVLTSTDFGMRRFKNLNAQLTALGSRSQHVINERLKNMKQTTRLAFEGVASSKAATTQFEYVKNALAALGPEDFETAHMGIQPDGRVLLQRAKPATTTAPAIPDIFLKYSDTAGTDIVLMPEVRTLFDTLQKPADELWGVRQAINGIFGRDTGAQRRPMWLPSPSLEHSMQAFIWDAKTSKVSRIIGNDMETFTQAVADYRAANAQAIADKLITVHMRNDTELGDWLRLRNLMELEGTTRPIPMMRRSGIAQHKITGSTQVLNQTLRDFEAEYNAVARQYIKVANQDVFGKLDILERFHKSPREAGPARSSFLAMQDRVSPATVAKATLLNTSLQYTNKPLTSIDNFVSFAIDRTNVGIRKAWAQGTKSDAAITRAFAEHSAVLRANNIPVPWQNEMQYAIDRTPELHPVAKDFVAKMNSIVATMALRLLDFSHPIVTTLSAPLIMSAEGVGQGGLTHIQAAKMIYETGRDWMRQAINSAASPEAYAILKQGEALGHTQRRISEATEAIAANFGSKNWLSRFTESKAFELMTWTSDHSESMTREMAYLMGYRLAQRTSPAADPAFLHSHAALFTNRAMGNYASRQRPVIFQGATGQAIGLFQTFMYTMGQNLFRYAENQNMRAISGMLGSYTGMFGLNSLPLYDVVDTAIGQWSKSPDDQDATQTIYQAFGNRFGGHDRSFAEYLLYGAPSTLLQTSFYTRGELQPRLPLNQGGLPVAPFVKMAADTLSTTFNIAKKMVDLQSTSTGQTIGDDFGDLGKSLLEGIAQQYMFRPAARYSELALGYSLDGKSETVVNGSDVRGPWAAFARLAGSRPLKEQIIRNQNYRHKLYDTADQRRVMDLKSAMRTRLRNGGDLSGLAGAYLHNGGSTQGLRQAINDIHLTESAPGAQALLRQVAKQPGIAAIMEGYTF